jgi:hypothetical protein
MSPCTTLAIVRWSVLALVLSMFLVVFVGLAP